MAPIKQYQARCDYCGSLSEWTDRAVAIQRANAHGRQHPAHNNYVRVTSR